LHEAKLLISRNAQNRVTAAAIDAPDDTTVTVVELLEVSLQPTRIERQSEPRIHAHRVPQRPLQRRWGQLSAGESDERQRDSKGVSWTNALRALSRADVAHDPVAVAHRHVGPQGGNPAAIRAIAPLCSTREDRGRASSAMGSRLSPRGPAAG